MTTIAEVRLWGRTIGAVSLGDGDDVAAFEYDPVFAASGVEVFTAGYAAVQARLSFSRSCRKKHFMGCPVC